MAVGKEIPISGELRLKYVNIGIIGDYNHENMGILVNITDFQCGTCRLPTSHFWQYLYVTKCLSGMCSK